MVRIKRSYRIQVCDTKIRPQWRAPLGSSTDRQTANRPDTKLCKKPALLFIVAPRAQASRRCETQAPLGGTPPKLCYRFGPLPPSARSANLIAGDGMKNGFPAPNKEPTTNQKHHLTGKVSIRRGPRKDIPRGRPSGRHGTILSPALAGKGRGGALMRDLCCYAVILRRRWMTRRFAGTGSFAKCNHERPDNSPT